MNAKLTPYDSELILMIESITEIKPEVRYSFRLFQISAPYGDMSEQKKKLLREAVEGRCGKRLADVQDLQSEKVITFTIDYSKEKFPLLVGDCRHVTYPSEDIGNTYCHRLQEVKALKVERYNAKKLEIFVGGGEMQIPEEGEAVFSFLNNGVFVDVPEHWYIIYDNEQFFVESAENFEREWELK